MFYLPHTSHQDTTNPQVSSWKHHQGRSLSPIGSKLNVMSSRTFCVTGHRFDKVVGQDFVFIRTSIQSDYLKKKSALNSTQHKQLSHVLSVVVRITGVKNTFILYSFLLAFVEVLCENKNNSQCSLINFNDSSTVTCCHVII